MTEQPHIACVRTMQGFQGASEFDQQRIERFPIGCQIDIPPPRLKRSGPRHRFYFAILGEVQPNLPDDLGIPSVDVLHDEIKMALGYRKPMMLEKGTQLWLPGPHGRPELLPLPEDTTVFGPGSIAFDKMDDATFAEFMARAFLFISTVLIPGLDINALKRRAKDALGPTYDKDAA